MENKEILEFNDDVKELSSSQMDFARESDTHILVAIYDRMAQSFGNIMQFVNLATAKRYFQVQMKKLDADGFSAKDYDLFDVGSYDFISGSIISDGVHLIVTGGEVVNG